MSFDWIHLLLSMAVVIAEAAVDLFAVAVVVVGQCAIGLEILI